MGQWWRNHKPGILGSAIYNTTSLIGTTLRLAVVGEEVLQACEGGKIICGWHGRTMLAALRWRNRGYYSMVSHSRDGEMQNRIFTRFGFKTIRGSAGRGGARAAAECVKVLRSGETLVFTPDGPRGPSREVKDGTVWLAQKGRSTLIPGGASARPRKLMSSWDRYMVPYPFAKCAIVLGEPIRVPEDATEKDRKTIGDQLRDAMNSAEMQADEMVGMH